MPANSPTPAAHSPWRAVLGHRLAGALIFGALAIVALCAGAPPALAADAHYEGASADGSVVFFSTTEQLVPGDTDNRTDVYERSFDESLGEYVTREVSTGPLGGNSARDAQYDGASADGKKVFFSTQEPLVAEDTDQSTDIYMRNLSTNETVLVSQGDSSCAAEGCGNGSASADFVSGGVVPAGNRVFFATTEKLSAGDEDGSLDIYMRNLSTNETVLVSQGDSSCAAEGCGNGTAAAFFEQASADGERVAFTTEEALVGGDENERQDIYQRDLGTETTKLVSTPGECPESAEGCDPIFRGMSSDGSHVFFESLARIGGVDKDEAQDVYDWSEGAGATLVSTGTEGEKGEGAYDARFAGASSNGAAVFFETDEKLSSADGDTVQDVYERSGGETTLVSTGPESRNGPAPASFDWALPDGSAVFFSTAEALTSEDTDESRDIYERLAEETVLVSTGAEGEEGNGSHDASFERASNDGSHVFFSTAEQLVPGDTDGVLDIYDRSGGATALISRGQFPYGNGEFAPHLRGISQDGSTAFFTTKERLTEDDRDGEEEDIYQRREGETRLVSVGNTQALGPVPPSGLTTVPGPTGESATPSIHGQVEAGTTIKIYTKSDCSGAQAEAPGGEPAGGTAAQFNDPEVGIPVKVAVGSTTTFYATAEAEGLVSGCSSPVTYTQETPPPPPAEEEEPSGGGETGGTGGGESSESGGGSGGSGGGAGSGSSGTPAKTYGGGIAYVAPETRITFGPSFKTRKRRPVFRFVDATGQPGTSFICRLDRHHWHSCGSPVRLKRLGGGKHVFKVKAVNAVGVWAAKVAKRRFKIVRHRGKRRLHRRHRRARRARR